MTTIYAIGHSMHPIDKFVELLQAYGITLLADIRTIPKSRNNPQFNADSLASELPKAKIQYKHLKNLRAAAAIERFDQHRLGEHQQCNETA